MFTDLRMWDDAKHWAAQAEKHGGQAVLVDASARFAEWVQCSVRGVPRNLFSTYRANLCQSPQGRVRGLFCSTFLLKRHRALRAHWGRKNKSTFLQRCRRDVL